MYTINEVLLIVEKNLMKRANRKGKVDIKDIENELLDARIAVHDAENEAKPIKKFIFVEDGSVDTDELEETLAERNPEIKVIVYRQGACPPVLKDITEVE